MGKGSVWKNTPEGKTVRRNQIPKGQQWSWWTTEMLESPAYRVLSLSAHMVIARVRLENNYHAGKDNGRLPVTFRDFVEYGIHWNGIAPAIREAEALGFIRVTEWGRAGNGEWRRPTLFALTHLPVGDKAATNDWQKIETMEQARAIAKLARMATQKQNATSGKRISPTSGIRISKPKTPLVESVSQDDSKSVSLSISREGSAAGASGQPVLPLRSEPRLIHPKRVGKLRTATAEPEPLPSGLLEWTKPTLTEIKYTDELRKLYRCETSDEAA